MVSIISSRLSDRPAAKLFQSELFFWFVREQFWLSCCLLSVTLLPSRSLRRHPVQAPNEHLFEISLIQNWSSQCWLQNIFRLLFLNFSYLQDVARKLWQTDYYLQSSGTFVSSWYEHDVSPDSCAWLIRNTLLSLGIVYSIMPHFTTTPVTRICDESCNRRWKHCCCRQGSKHFLFHHSEESSGIQCCNLVPVDVIWGSFSIRNDAFQMCYLIITCLSCRKYLPMCEQNTSFIPCW